MEVTEGTASRAAEAATIDREAPEGIEVKIIEVAEGATAGDKAVRTLLKLRTLERERQQG
jgi:hypothetical protein